MCHIAMDTATSTVSSTGTATVITNDRASDGDVACDHEHGQAFGPMEHWHFEMWHKWGWARGQAPAEIPPSPIPTPTPHAYPDPDPELHMPDPPHPIPDPIPRHTHPTYPRSANPSLQRHHYGVHALCEYEDAHAKAPTIN